MPSGLSLGPKPQGADCPTTTSTGQIHGVIIPKIQTQDCDPYWDHTSQHSI